MLDLSTWWWQWLLYRQIAWDSNVSTVKVADLVRSMLARLPFFSCREWHCVWTATGTLWQGTSQTMWQKKWNKFIVPTLCIPSFYRPCCSLSVCRWVRSSTLARCSTLRVLLAVLLVAYCLWNFPVSLDFFFNSLLRLVRHLWFLRRMRAFLFEAAVLPLACIISSLR